MKERAVYSIMALVLVLGMALTLATPVGAATVTFTGNVTADFTGAGILTIPDPGGVGDVGLPTSPPLPPPGTVSGWDMIDLRLTYDPGTDILYVGINTYGIAGDADGDGDPSVTSAWLAAKLGTDIANLGSTECIAIFFDLDKDGTYDVIAGVPAGEDISGFTVANFSGFPANPAFAFGADLPTHTGIHTTPAAGTPDFEFTILNFSTLPGSDASLGGFVVQGFLGSIEDDGIGEDFIQYEQNPHTITTIVSSAPTVVSGGSVTLTVTEYNSGNVSLTSPQVAVTKDGAPLATLVSPPDSGDTADFGVLNVGETWTWALSSGAITATTTFVARGSGTAPGDFPVDYVTDPLEEDDVDVDTINPDTITTITSSATEVVSGGSVLLTVTEQNTGDDPLTNPYVQVRKNGVLLTTLVAPPSSGDNGNNILDTTETWTWTNVPSGPITALTTFEALGFGTDSLLNEISFATGHLGERDTVDVDTIEPDTITTIASSATEVVSGGSVLLTVTEQNTGNDPLTNPYVEVRKNGVLLTTLVAPPSSGDNGNNILDIGETWTWSNVPSGPITALTTFEALGFGTDSLLNEISFATGHLGERDTVDVDTIEPDTITTIASSATEVVSGGSVLLTVTEQNTGDDPLTNPYVQVRKNGVLLTTLVAPPSSGDNGNNILDTTETWTWSNVPSGPITALTTFEALGFGTDSLLNEISFATGHLGERDTVDVDTIEPDTITTITSSATEVVSGGSVLLTVTEQNTGDDPLTNPYVQVRKNGVLLTTLVAPPSSGDNGNNILDTTETWTWSNVPSGPITALTTFEALGFGTDSLLNEISFATGHLGERDTVDVDTIEPDTITTITSSATLVDPGDSVLLTVTERNTGGDPLTNPYVEVRQNGVLIHTLDETTPGWSSNINGDAVLDVGETWTWTNIPSNPITVATTFEALGFGTDSLLNEISFATGHLGERDTVRVDVKGEGCLEICKFQDSNVNSIWDPGEPWLPDWRFRVTGPAGYDRWVTTGPDGCVVLLDLASGTYTVTEELKAGWYNTKPGGDPPYEQKVTVGISLDCARVEFGNREEIRDIPPMIPAMNNWGIIAMITLFAGLLVWTVRRKRLAA